MIIKTGKASIKDIEKSIDNWYGGRKTYLDYKNRSDRDILKFIINDIKRLKYIKVYKIFMDNKIVGFIEISSIPKKIANYNLSIKINNIIISPNARNAGLGKRLIDLSVKMAKELGAINLVLQSRADTFYKKQGFHSIENNKLQSGFVKKID